MSSILTSHSAFVSYSIQEGVATRAYSALAPQLSFETAAAPIQDHLMDPENPIKMMALVQLLNQVNTLGSFPQFFLQVDGQLGLRPKTSLNLCISAFKSVAMGLFADYLDSPKRLQGQGRLSKLFVNFGLKQLWATKTCTFGFP